MASMSNKGLQPGVQQAAAYGGLFGLLFLALTLHVMPAVLVGLLAFVLCRALLTAVRLRLPTCAFPERAVSLVVGVGSVTVLSLLGFGLAKALNGENVSDLLMTLAHTLEQSKKYLPADISTHIPDSVLDIKQVVADIAKKHAVSVASFGSHTAHTAVLLLVGWLVGCLAACRSAPALNDGHPVFYQTWRTIWSRFAQAFEAVASAQVKVAAFNASCMAAFLFVLSPLIGWDIPYAKTLVLATFVLGMIPVVGNLLSNTLTCVLALTVSVPAACAALLFLVVIHKAEYLILSKALGAETGTQIWELLIVLFAGQILFGMVGMVTAPILYTFIRGELRHYQWLPSQEPSYLPD